MYSFLPGLSANTETNLETILQTLSSKERNALHNDIKLESCDSDVFPDLLEFTKEEPTMGDQEEVLNATDMKGLKDTLTEAVETEDSNTVAILIEHLIKNRYEHLLVHLL